MVVGFAVGGGSGGDGGGCAGRCLRAAWSSESAGIATGNF